MKLSGAPLLAVGGCYFVWARRERWPARLGVACVAGAAFLGVLGLAGLISSGCAFFPWPRLCTDLPWSVGREAAQWAADIIYKFALGTLDRPDLQGTALLAVWVKSNFSSACWIALSLVAAVWLLLRRKRLDVPGLGWASAVGAVGVPFILVTAPAGRFGMSYLVVLPLLALLTLRAPSARILSQGISNLATRRALGIAATAVVTLVVALPLYKEFVESKPRAKSYESMAHRKQGDPTVNEFNARWWLLPNRYAELPGFSTVRAHDFDYSMPPASAPLCWHHALPCTSYKPTGVRLRDPAAGLSGGFVRVGAAETRKDSSCARSSSRRKPYLWR
jgi:hypothetical protein